MANKTLKQIVVITLLFSILFTLASCGGEKQKHTWGSHQFTAEYQKKRDNYEYTGVDITLKFGNEGISKDVLDAYLGDAKITLAGKEPTSSYLYTKTNDGKMKTVQISFIMEKGYEYKDTDLVVIDD